MRFKVKDQVHARVGGRQELDGTRKPQEKRWPTAGMKSGPAAGKKEEAHHRPQVKESSGTLERRRAGASSIVT